MSQLRAAARAVLERRGGPLAAGSRPAFERSRALLVRRILLGALLLGLVGSMTGTATFSAFSSTAANGSDSFAAGTVYLTDNDAASAMYAVTNQKPGDVVTTCIKLTYTGTLPADVRLYTTSTVNALGNYIDLTVERGQVSSGTPTFPACTNFVADSTIYSGTLGAFAAAKDSYVNGIAAYPGAQTAWNQNDTLWYRFTLTLEDDNAANGLATPLSTGPHAFTWEARNQ